MSTYNVKCKDTWIWIHICLVYLFYINKDIVCPAVIEHIYNRNEDRLIRLLRLYAGLPVELDDKITMSAYLHLINSSPARADGTADVPWTWWTKLASMHAHDRTAPLYGGRISNGAGARQTIVSAVWSAAHCEQPRVSVRRRVSSGVKWRSSGRRVARNWDVYTGQWYRGRQRDDIVFSLTLVISSVMW